MANVKAIEHNPAMAGMVELKTNVVYAAPDGEELAMQIIRPMWKPEDAGFPLVVFIQGSAWTKPDQFWEIPQLSLLARRGFVVASVTHRSCFTAPAPAFLVDVKEAVRFLRAHAADYGIDRRRVCAWGTSSGGNTALLLGMTGDDPAFKSSAWADESDAVQAVVDCFGPTDLIKMIQQQFRDVPMEQKKLLYALGGGETEEAYRPRLEAISPIARVRPGMNYPPMLTLHGDADELVLYEDTEAFCAAMEACGYEVEQVQVHGAPHEGSFWSLPLLEIIFDFIQRRIGTAG